MRLSYLMNLLIIISHPLPNTLKFDYSLNILHFCNVSMYQNLKLITLSYDEPLTNIHKNHLNDYKNLGLVLPDNTIL